MPELPEVETVRRQLERVWRGRAIERVQAGADNYFFVTPPATLRRKLRGERLQNLERRGKYLIAQFQSGQRLLLHLGMTGQFVARRLPADGHVHLVFFLEGSQVVSFRDVRKFGKVELLPPQMSCPRLEKLGPDALSAPSLETANKMRRRKAPIKAVLLDQALWAGVGNIYADEALFSAGIRPTRSAARISVAAAKRLVRATQTILQQAIEAGGSTINDYIQPEGELGGFQNWHQVYGKLGQPCPRCHAAIRRVAVAGRSSHFCPRCQK